MRQYPSALLSLLLLTTVATAQKVKVEFDRSEDFRQHVTWAWHPETAPPQPTIRMDADLVDEIVRSAVEGKLLDLGYRKVPVEEADFLVTYILSSIAEVDTTHYDPGNSPWAQGSYGHWRPFFEGETATSVIRKGMLIVDFVDARDKTLFWRGMAEQVLKEKPASEKDARKIVGKAINKLLKRYPRYQSQ